MNCGKKRYPYERMAKDVAEDQMERAKDAGDSLDLRVYKCEECGGWHLTKAKS